MMYKTIEKLIKQIGIIDKNLKITPITVGASGSEVFELVSENERMILKLINIKLADSNQSQTFMKEWDFYNRVKDMQIPFIPKVLHIYKNVDFALILMKEYESMKARDWDQELQEKVIDLIINVHMLPKTYLPEQMKDKQQENQEDPKYYYEEWSKLLNEYQESFDTASLESIYHDFDKIVNIDAKLPECLVHGDFHLNNILYDKEDGRLILCDWQNVGIGIGTDEISFFVSRGNSDGMNLDDIKLLEHYCEKYSFISGNEINVADVLTQNAKQTVLVSFKFWHFYLHGAEYERVKQIYEQMEKSYEYLREKFKPTYKI
jgi:aminoglycoside phosphotransferase